MVGMDTEKLRIADKVRGVMTEKRYSQQRVADVLKVSRGSVSERYNGKVAFGAHELMTLAQEVGEPITRFFPEDVTTISAVRGSVAA